MNKEKLTIENLAPYLPYELKCRNSKKSYLQIGKYRIGVLQQISVNDDSLILNEGGYFLVHYSEIIPILRPLSDLTKEIEHNGEKFVPLEVLNEKVQLFGNSYEIYIDNNNDVRLLANYHKGKDVIRGFDPKNMLMKWHFDVFGLIDKGLAINLNEVK